MEPIQVGDRVTTKTVGSNAFMITGEVVEVTENIVRFLLDAGQSEFGENIRPVFSRPLHKIRKL